MADGLPSNLDAIIDELPSGAAAIGLVRSKRLPHWAAGQAIGLANGSGSRGGRTLLLNLEPAPSHLDRLVGGLASRGLSAVLRGEASPSDTALTSEGRGFIYFPAGAKSAGPPALSSLPALERLIHQTMSRGAIVLLYLPEEAVVAEAGDLVDAWVLLGCEAPKEATAVPILGRLRGPRKDEPGPDASVVMARRKGTASEGKVPSGGGLAVLSRPRHRGRPPRRSRTGRRDALPALLFVYLLVVAFGVTLWLLEPGPLSHTAPAEPDIGTADLPPADSAESSSAPLAPDDTLPDRARPYSSITGSETSWVGVEETIRKLDSLFNDSTPTADRQR